MKKLRYTPVEIEIIFYSVEQGFAASSVYLNNDDNQLNPPFSIHSDAAASGNEITNTTDNGGEFNSGSWDGAWDNF